MSLTVNAALQYTTQIKEIASCARHPRRMLPLVGAGVPDFTYFTRSVGGVSPLFIVRCEKAGAGLWYSYSHRRCMVVLRPGCADYSAFFTKLRRFSFNYNLQPFCVACTHQCKMLSACFCSWPACLTVILHLRHGARIFLRDRSHPVVIHALSAHAGLIFFLFSGPKPPSTPAPFALEGNALPVRCLPTMSMCFLRSGKFTALAELYVKNPGAT